MAYYVNFQDGSTYSGAKFRRMLGRMQDQAAGFDTASSLMPSPASSDRRLVDVAPGAAWISDGIGGVYWVESDAVVTVDPVLSGVTEGAIIAQVTDRSAGDRENALVIRAVSRAGIPVGRYLLLGEFSIDADQVGVTDQRLNTSGQFLVTRSGPARVGAPSEESADLEPFAAGTQYTDLGTGYRYVKTREGAWIRDQGPAGSVDNLTGLKSPMKVEQDGPGDIFKVVGKGESDWLFAINSTGRMVANRTADFQRGLVASGDSVASDALTVPSGRFKVSDGNTYLNGSVEVGSPTGSFGNGVGVLGIGNANTPPTAKPSNGGVLWSQNGDLKLWSDNGVNGSVGDAVKGWASPSVTFTPTTDDPRLTGTGNYVRISNNVIAFTMQFVAAGAARDGNVNVSVPWRHVGPHVFWGWWVLSTEIGGVNRSMVQMTYDDNASVARLWAMSRTQAGDFNTTGYVTFGKSDTFTVTGTAIIQPGSLG
ncbi:hypothetical protein ACIQU6_29095 [Streptomyces sp. NPDC090442]|uniref:hypothetical protein n=1 Tax=Streptomyces sp. NPDC090442 TaxID=3365962 RepID=UPI003824A2E2